jgi:hypothetical protein
LPSLLISGKVQFTSSKAHIRCQRILSNQRVREETSLEIDPVAGLALKGKTEQEDKLVPRKCALEAPEWVFLLFSKNL